MTGISSGANCDGVGAYVCEPKEKEHGMRTDGNMMHKFAGGSHAFFWIPTNSFVFLSAASVGEQHGFPFTTSPPPCAPSS
jgi:hypothetical protein